MAVTYVNGNAQSGTLSGGSTATVTHTVPAHQAGDVLILALTSREAYASAGLTGWTLSQSDSYAPGNTNYTVNGELYYKVAASSSETCSYSITRAFTGQGAWVSHLTVYRGSDASSPIDASKFSQAGNTTSGITVSALTATADGSMQIVAERNTGAPTNFTTALTNAPSDTHYKAVATAGSTSSLSLSTTNDGGNGSGSYVCFSFIIKPGASRKAVRHSYWM